MTSLHHSLRLPVETGRRVCYLNRLAIPEGGGETAVVLLGTDDGRALAYAARFEDGEASSRDAATFFRLVYENRHVMHTPNVSKRVMGVFLSFESNVVMIATECGAVFGDSPSSRLASLIDPTNVTHLESHATTTVQMYDLQSSISHVIPLPHRNGCVVSGPMMIPRSVLVTLERSLDSTCGVRVTALNERERGGGGGASPQLLDAVDIRSSPTRKRRRSVEEQNEVEWTGELEVVSKLPPATFVVRRDGTVEARDLPVSLEHLKTTRPSVFTVYYSEKRKGMTHLRIFFTEDGSCRAAFASLEVSQTIVAGTSLRLRSSCLIIALSASGRLLVHEFANTNDDERDDLASSSTTTSTTPPSNPLTMMIDSLLSEMRTIDSERASWAKREREVESESLERKRFEAVGSAQTSSISIEAMYEEGTLVSMKLPEISSSSSFSGEIGTEDVSWHTAASSTCLVTTQRWEGDLAGRGSFRTFWPAPRSSPHRASLSLPNLSCRGLWDDTETTRRKLTDPSSISAYYCFKEDGKSISRAPLRRDMLSMSMEKGEMMGVWLRTGIIMRGVGSPSDGASTTQVCSFRIHRPSLHDSSKNDSEIESAESILNDLILSSTPNASLNANWRMTSLSRTRAVLGFVPLGNMRISLELGMDRLLDFTLTAPNVYTLVRLREALAHRVYARWFGSVREGILGQSTKIKSEEQDDDGMRRRELVNRTRDEISSLVRRRNRVSIARSSSSASEDGVSETFAKLAMETWQAGRGVNV